MLQDGPKNNAFGRNQSVSQSIRNKSTQFAAIVGIKNKTKVTQWSQFIIQSEMSRFIPRMN